MKKKSKRRRKNNYHHTEFDRALENKRLRHLRDINQGNLVREQNEKKILLSLSSHPEGLRTLSLSKETGIHRKTVFLICQNLIDNGLVVKKGGKQGKYKITSKVFNYPAFRAYFFEREAVRRLLNSTKPIDPAYIFNAVHIWKGSKFCNNTLAEEIAMGYNGRLTDEARIYYFSRNLIPATERKDEDALLLFEFANRVGFLITYVFLQALNPELIDEATTTASTHIVAATKEGLLSKPVLDWIDNAINIRSLYTAFTKAWFIDQRLNPPVTNICNIFNDLATAFAAAYPAKYYEEMDKIRKDMGKLAPEILEDSERWIREHKLKKGLKRDHHLARP